MNPEWGLPNLVMTFILIVSLIPMTGFLVYRNERVSLHLTCHKPIKLFISMFGKFIFYPNPGIYLLKTLQVKTWHSNFLFY